MESLNINPWGEIWIHPKKTMRALLNWDPKKIILWLAILGGIISAGTFLGQAWQKHPDWALSKKTGFFIGTLIAGGLLGLFHLYFGGWLYKVTSQWIGGKGDFISTKCAVGWSNYPVIVANLLVILDLVFFPNLWTQIIFGLSYAIVAIWSFVIFLNLLGEAQQFSAWKALLAVLIAAVLIFVAVMIIAVLIPLLSPLFSHPVS